MAYTKLFSSIITSTIWSEDDTTRIVWITMLACADRNGEVQGSIPGLARLAGVSVDACRAAVGRFLSPDPDSRTKDDEGRRVEEIDGGWHLLNHKKYRDMACDEDRKNKAAIRQQRARDRKSRNGHAPVTPKSRQISQAEAEAEAEAKGGGEPPRAASPQDDAHLPTREEVIAYGKTVLIPEDYSGQFHDKTSEKHMWLNAHGRLVDWKKQVVRFWAGDRATWRGINQRPAKPPAKLSV